MPNICRAPACGCETNATYCDHCEQFTPICPICGAVYGEHRNECTVADGYDDCGEGPFDSREDAETFAAAEVGAAWQVEGAAGKWFVLVRDGDEEAADDDYHERMMGK